VPLDQVLVGDDRLQVRLGHLVGEDDVLLDGVELVGVCLDLVHQRGVDEQYLVGGVVDSELKVAVGQPHVTHVEAPARTARREVELEVSVVVHRDRPDPAALGDAQVVEGVPELGDPVGRVRVGVAVCRPVRLERDNLPVREQVRRAADDPVDGELNVHHRHLFTSPGSDL